MSDRPELLGDDPFALYQQWLHEAESSEPNDPNAAALATSTADGHPSVRMVLLKPIDDAHGFSFFTNAGSQKGSELEENPHAALVLHWKSLRRQIRAQGPITLLPGHASDEYFHSRSRRSQIGAAVSRQSRPLANRKQLEDEVAAFAASHPDGDIPRPDFWQGYLLTPSRIEFWIDGPDRLHDRILFTRQASSTAEPATVPHWTRTRLYP